jgi:Immunity protein 50
MISQSESVKSIFGYWPEFADAKVVLVAYEQPDVIRLHLSYIDVQLEKAAVVSLQFSGVKDLELTGLSSENVLDSLSISADMPMRVELEACYGLSGSFTCTGAEVSGVAPNNSFKPKR